MVHSGNLFLDFMDFGQNFTGISRKRQCRNPAGNTARLPFKNQKLVPVIYRDHNFFYKIPLQVKFLFRYNMFDLILWQEGLQPALAHPAEG